METNNEDATSSNKNSKKEKLKFNKILETSQSQQSSRRQTLQKIEDNRFSNKLIDEIAVFSNRQSKFNESELERLCETSGFANENKLINVN